jgi:hypothetical protein
MGKLHVKRKQAVVKAKKPTKPLKAGTIDGVVADPVKLPSGNTIKRYIITSAQNNTNLHEGLWKNLLALRAHYNAELVVGRFTYNKSAYGPASVKPNTADESDHDSPWYDPRLEEFTRDARVQLGKGLVWCGESNIIPTAGDPLRGFEDFAGRQSCIFPHSTIAMRSVAATEGSGAKLIYATGTVTQKNYIHMRAGLVAEFHHTFGALIVEVDSLGVWKVRQLDAEDGSGTIYDLTLKVEHGKVTDGHRVEAIVFGDIHATIIDETVLALSATVADNMIDTLRPKHIFIHDLMEGASVNHHASRKPLERFKTSLRELTVVENELKVTAEVLQHYCRPNALTVVVNSNHDRWLDRWLDEFDPHFDDARNLEIYHDGNASRLMQQRLFGKPLNVLEYLIRKYTHFTLPAQFLAMDESFLLCDKQLECGQHGDLGPNGSRGSAKALAKVGRPSVVGHYHSAGIWNGLYAVGTSTEFRMGYNTGPSSWTHSHCIVYENGKRTIITMYEKAWKA